MNKQAENIPVSSAWWRWSNLLHIVFNIALPIALLTLVRMNLETLAVLLALFSKWRVFAVRPRHLWVNLRANLTDLFVKLGSLVFIIQADTFTTQLAWTGWYVVWLVVVKPQTSKVWMGVQAMVGQLIGLSALFQFSESIDGQLLLVLVWVIASASARHFLINYEDTFTNTIALLWGLFVTELAWLLSRWLLVYLFVPQIALIVLVIGYTLATLYDAHQSGGLKPAFLRQQAIMSTLILAAIVLFADWQGEV